MFEENRKGDNSTWDVLLIAAYIKQCTQVVLVQYTYIVNIFFSNQLLYCEVIKNIFDRTGSVKIKLNTLSET